MCHQHTYVTKTTCEVCNQTTTHMDAIRDVTIANGKTTTQDAVFGERDSRLQPLSSLITDEGSDLNGWLNGLEGQRVYKRRTSTTSNLCVTYDHCSVIVLTKTDTPSSVWLAIEAARTQQLNALMDSVELEICLVIAPSHGALDGGIVCRALIRLGRALSRAPTPARIPAS